MLEETPSLCVIDVSFISLKLVLPVVASLLTEDGQLPTSSSRSLRPARARSARRGVVREPEIHLEVLGELCGKRTCGRLQGARRNVFAHQGAGGQH